MRFCIEGDFLFLTKIMSLSYSKIWANRDRRPRLQTVLHSLICVIKIKVKVNFTLEQVTKAQRSSRGIALLFL
jgi:hypothetical protein